VQDAALPAVDFDVPIGHTVQASARVFPVAPALAKYPAVQTSAVKVKHDPPLPVVYEPAGQIVHKFALLLPVLAVVKPAVHAVQDAALPAADLVVPIGQTVQASARVLAVAPAFAKYPAVQTSVVNVKQSDALEDPVAELYVPAAQRVHDVWPVDV
jgi:hypothetical protein